MIITYLNLQNRFLIINEIENLRSGTNLRKFTPNRWNWSQKAEKWVYVKSKSGKKSYKYQIDPPEEFLNLTTELNEINEKLMATSDVEAKEKYFTELQQITRKMQEMGKGS